MVQCPAAATSHAARKNTDSTAAGNALAPACHAVAIVAPGLFDVIENSIDFRNRTFALALEELEELLHLLERGRERTDAMHSEKKPPRSPAIHASTLQPQRQTVCTQRRLATQLTIDN